MTMSKASLIARWPGSCDQVHSLAGPESMGLAHGLKSVLLAASLVILEGF
jgi:hypothetical protein